MSLKPIHRIFVDTDIFAALWRERKPGEECENDILRRIYGLAGADQITERAMLPASPAQASRSLKGTVSDPPPVAVPAPGGAIVHSESGVDFADGFEIFRGHNQTEYRARIVQGLWQLPNGKRYASLEALNRAIGAGESNPWMAWLYRDRANKRRPLDTYLAPLR